MKKLILPSVLQTLFWTVVTGIVYPAAITLAAQVAFRRQAEGSLTLRGGEAVGSDFIAQPFQGAKYFWPRPSAGSFATLPSGASNLGPTSAALQANVAAAAKAFRSAHGLAAGAAVPADMVTTSASGVDPHISPEAARLQAARVAQARGLPAAQVLALVDAATEPPQWGFLGEARVNVLLLNLALDRAASQSAGSRGQP